MIPEHLLKEDLSIEDLFELLNHFFSPYIEYYESDLGGFLGHEFSKNYYIYIVLRIFFFITYITTVSLFVLLEATIITFVFGIIGITSLLLYYKMEMLILKNYKYTTAFFHGKRKRLLIFQKKLNLLLNNSILSEKFKTNKSELEMLRANSDKLKNRIENSSEFIQPLYYYIKKFALPTILFVPIITIFTNIIYDLIQNPIQFNEIVITKFILGLISLVLLIYPNLNSVLSVIKFRKTKEGTIYLFHETMIFLILEAIRLKIRMTQFPEEEKFKLSLRAIMEKMLEKLKTT